MCENKKHFPLNHVHSEVNMYNQPKIVSISVNYRQRSDVLSRADSFWSVVFFIDEPKVKQALEALSFNVSESGVECVKTEKLYPCEHMSEDGHFCTHIGDVVS